MNTSSRNRCGSRVLNLMILYACSCLTEFIKHGLPSILLLFRNELNKFRSMNARFNLFIDIEIILKSYSWPGNVRGLPYA